MQRIVFVLFLICVSLGCFKKPDDTPECEYCECTKSYDCDCDCEEECDAYADENVNDVFFSKLSTSPESIVSKENLPEWFIPKVNASEKNPYKLRFYRLEWRGQTFYFYLTNGDSSFWGIFYFENGTRLWNWSLCFMMECQVILIHEFGLGLIDVPVFTLT